MQKFLRALLNLLAFSNTGAKILFILILGRGKCLEFNTKQLVFRPASELHVLLALRTLSPLGIKFGRVSDYSALSNEGPPRSPKATKGKSHLVNAVQNLLRRPLVVNHLGQNVFRTWTGGLLQELEQLFPVFADLHHQKDKINLKRRCRKHFLCN